MKQISILGCGWLGLPLAKSLIKKGFIVKGSTTSATKLPLLESLGVFPYQITITEAEITGSVDDFLKQSEILIIDIPPKLRGTEKENFVSKIQRVIPEIQKSTVSKIIFVSSTSVFADNNEIITEVSVPKPTTESGIQILEAEKLLQKNMAFQTTIVRFGGLIGENRHPIYFLSGKKQVENPEAPINLIHLVDCIGIIETIMEQDCWNETFNAVTPFHPSRQAYYTQKALDLNLPLPEFDDASVSNGKTILSNKIEKNLHYQFKINPL